MGQRRLLFWHRLGLPPQIMTVQDMFRQVAVYGCSCTCLCMTSNVAHYGFVDELGCMRTVILLDGIRAKSSTLSTHGVWHTWLSYPRKATPHDTLHVLRTCRAIADVTLSTSFLSFVVPTRHDQFRFVLGSCSCLFRRNLAGLILGLSGDGTMR